MTKNESSTWDQDVVVMTALLREVRFSIRGYTKALRNPRFFPLLMVFVLVMMIADPSGMTKRFPFYTIFFLWVLFSFLFMALEIGALTLWRMLGKESRSRVLFLPVLDFILVAFLTVLGDVLTTVVEGRFPYISFSIYEILFYFFCAQIIQTMFVMHAPAAVYVDQQPKPKRTWLKTGEGSYLIADILHMSTQEHYVQIALDGRSDLVRGPMTKFLEQLSDEDGIQIHRSHWLAASSIRRVQRRQGNLIITTRDGIEWSVARNRSAPVKAWLGEHGFMY